MVDRSVGFYIFSEDGYHIAVRDFWNIVNRVSAQEILKFSNSIINLKSNKAVDIIEFIVEQGYKFNEKFRDVLDSSEIDRLIDKSISGNNNDMMTFIVGSEDLVKDYVENCAGVVILDCYSRSLDISAAYLFQLDKYFTGDDLDVDIELFIENLKECRDSYVVSGGLPELFDDLYELSNKYKDDLHKVFFIEEDLNSMYEPYSDH